MNQLASNWPAQLRLPAQDALPVEPAGACFAVGLKAFDRQDAPAKKGLHGCDRAVGRPVVEKIDVDALLDEIADDRPDDVGFVVRGDYRDNRKR